MGMSKEYEMLFSLRGRLGSDFTSSFSKAQKQTAEFSKAISEMNRAVGDITAYKKAAADIQRYNAELKALNDATENGEKATGKQKKEIEALKKSVQKAQDQMDKYAQKMNDMGVATEKADAELEKYQKEMDKLRQKKQSLDDLTDSWEKQRTAILKTYGQLKTTVGVYAGVMAAGYTAVVAPAAELQQSMANVKAYFGASDSEVAALKEIARETGLTTKYSSADSALAFEEMAKAGWNVEEASAGLPGVVSLAAASDEDLGTVTGTVVELLNTFKADASQSGYFADVLSAAAMGSTADVSDLNESLKYTGAIASAMGFSFADTLLGLGLLANGGIKGSQAGTSMRRIMTAATSDLTYTDANDQEIFRVKTADEEGNMRSFRDILTDLRAAMNGLSESELAALADDTDARKLAEEYGIDGWEEMDTDALYDALEAERKALSEADQAVAAEGIAMKTAMSALLTLVNTSDENFEQLAHDIDNCTGAAEEMAKIKLDTLQGDIEALQSAMEETAITAGDVFLPDLREVAQRAAEVVGEVNDWIVANDDLVHDMGEFAAKAGPYIAGFLGVKLGIQGIVGVGTKATLFFKTIKQISTGGWISGIATGLVAVGGAAAYLHTKATEAKLDEMFGDIALSAEEVDEAVRHIVDTRVFEDAAEAMAAFDGLEEITQQIDDYKTAIAKDVWKIGMGFEYSEDDLRECQANVDAMMSEIMDYIAERGFAAELGIKSILGADYEYEGSTSILLERVKSAAETLADEFAAAFEDGAAPDPQVIANAMQEALTEAERIMEAAEYGTKYTMLAAEYGGAALTRKSYNEVVSALDEYAAEGIEKAKSAFNESTAIVWADLLLARDEYNNAEAGSEEQKAAAARVAKLESAQKELASSGYTTTLGSAYLDIEDWQYQAVNELTGGALDKLTKGVAEMYKAVADGGTAYDTLEKYQGYYDALSYEERLLLRDYATRITSYETELSELLRYSAENGDLQTMAEAQGALGIAALISDLGTGSGKIGEAWQTFKGMLTGTEAYGFETYGPDNVIEEILELSEGTIYGEYTEGDYNVGGVTIQNTFHGVTDAEEIALVISDKVNEAMYKNEARQRAHTLDMQRRSLSQPVSIAR